LTLAKPAVVVFDLDGTLIDSRPDLTTAVNRMRAGLGLPELPEDAVGAMIGDGARVLVERALADRPGALGAEGNSAALASFLAHYAAACTAATRPYEGVEELLEGVARRWPLALLTNKPIAMTRVLLEHFGWGRRFRAVIGGDSLPFRKPDGRILAGLAAALGSAPAGTLLVGDSRIDAQTARAAGSPFVWVEWGYAPPRDRGELAAGPCAPTPQALLAWLAAL
jgi:phosphoglycolate phosphatase